MIAKNDLKEWIHTDGHIDDIGVELSESTERNVTQSITAGNNEVGKTDTNTNLCPQTPQVKYTLIIKEPRAEATAMEPNPFLATLMAWRVSGTAEAKATTVMPIKEDKPFTPSYGMSRNGISIHLPVQWVQSIDLRQ